jgi:hypothetical protein
MSSFVLSKIPYWLQHHNNKVPEAQGIRSLAIQTGADPGPEECILARCQTMARSLLPLSKYSNI